MNQARTPVVDEVLTHNVGYANYQLDELIPVARSLEMQRDALREALEPFAKFVFGPRWAGHVAIEEKGDSIVLCGYDEQGNVTGVNVNYRDFLKARAALQPKEDK